MYGLIYEKFKPVNLKYNNLRKYSIQIDLYVDTSEPSRGEYSTFGWMTSLFSFTVGDAVAVCVFPVGTAVDVGAIPAAEEPFASCCTDFVASSSFWSLSFCNWTISSSENCKIIIINKKKISQILSFISFINNYNYK